jgi:hypothetical protein
MTERPQAPRRPRPVDISSSHSRPTEPFPRADDVEELNGDEVHEVPDSEPPPTPLKQLRDEMRDGFRALSDQVLTGRKLDREYLHDQLNLVRRDVTVVHERLGIEVKRTLGAKVAGGTGATVKWGGYISLALIVLNMAAKKVPWLADVAAWLNENASLFQ